MASSASAAAGGLPAIDLHTHILPPDMPHFGDGFISIRDHAESGGKAMFKGDEFFRKIDARCVHAEARIADCDRDGVAVQVLSTVPVMFNYDIPGEQCLPVARFLNDHLAGLIREHPTRFVGLGTLPMQAPELAVAELRRCVSELGLAGVQIGTHVNEWKLSAPELFPVFKEAERLGACIFVHPWYMAGISGPNVTNETSTKYWLPWLVEMPAETSDAICSLIFSGVMERLPKLRFAFAHGGGSFPATIARIEHGFNVRPDLCACDNNVNPRKYLGHFWLDSLVHDERMLEYLVDLIGQERVVVGSDYPFPLGEHTPGKLVRNMSAWSEERKALLLWRNALAFLGRSPADFGMVPHAEQAANAEANAEADAEAERAPLL